MSLGEIHAPLHTAPRYSARPFPAYRYVPGEHPHPTRDPRGHSYEPTPALNRHAPWQPSEWRTLGRWLYGVDLFNARYYWEAHEAWEGLWAAEPRGTDASLLMQGLIQVAAALLKTHMQTVEGVRLLSMEGVDKLDRVAAMNPQMMGVNVAEMVATFGGYFAPAAAGQLPRMESAPTITLDMPVTP